MDTHDIPAGPGDEIPDIGDRNVERLLGHVYKPEMPDPGYVQRVEEQLCAAARELAQSRVLATDPLRPGPGSRSGKRHRLAWALPAVAAAAILSLSVQFLPRKTHRPQDSSPDATQARLPDLGHSASPEGLTPRKRPDAPSIPSVAPGDEIRTEAGHRRRVVLPDGSVLYLNQNTVVKLDGDRHLTLTSGEVYIEVAPRGDGATFAVQTPSREISALGTKFTVRTDPAGTGVMVTQGRVRVAGLDSLLSAGQQLNPGKDEIAPAPRASHTLEWARDLMAAAQSPLVPGSQYAGGALVAVDPSGQEARLGLRKFHVDLYLEDGFARTTIDQTYFNHNPWRMEGTFYFPLPPDASLSRLAMYVDGNLMEGGMAERDYTRQVFETIMYTRKDPALLEWVDGSTFKMRVFPLEGRQEKRIVLSYTQRLESLYGGTHYRFPAGHNLEVVRDWSFHGFIKNGVGLKWFSPSHPAMKATKKGDDLAVDVADRGIKIDQDVVLELQVPNGLGRAADRASFAVAEHEKSQYLMVRYRPRLAGQPVRQRRDWIFLFESSGDRDPLLARAQADVVRSLLVNAEHEDTFALLTAGTGVRALAPAPVAATPENIQKAMDFLDRVHLVGALDLEKALKTAAPLIKSASNPYLVHVGSAIPAIGERRDNMLAKLVPDGCRYVGVGVGKRWNRSLLKTAADKSGGYFTQINPDEAAAWRGFDLAATLNTPRLLNVNVVDDAERVQFLLCAASLAQGEELCAIARIAPGQPLPASVSIAGTLDGKPYHRTFKVAGAAPRADYLPRTWTKLEIDRLLAEDGAKHKDRIVALSKAMYVMTPFTSLLVLENEQMYEQYKVDRGRKDHWALYPCPDKIPVVYEPLPDVVDTRNAPKSETVVQKPTEDQVLQSILIRPAPRFLSWPNAPVVNQPVVYTAWQSYWDSIAADGPHLYAPVDFDGMALVQPPVTTLTAMPSAQTRTTSFPEELGRLSGGGGFSYDGFTGRFGGNFSGGFGDGFSGGFGGGNFAGGFTGGFGGFNGLGGGFAGSFGIGFNADAGLVTNFHRDFRGLEGAQTLTTMTVRGVDPTPPKETVEIITLAETRLRGRQQTARLPNVASRPDFARSTRGYLNLGSFGWATDWQDPHRASVVYSRIGRSYSNQGLIYQRPAFSGDERIFYDLVAYAPGMNTTWADIQAVVDAESRPAGKRRTGSIDPAAKALIDRARSSGWQQVTLSETSGQPEFIVVFDGSNRYAYERTLASGLGERVICDGRTLVHLYPELGIGARRSVSPFHRAAASDLIPWALPPAADLAQGADVRMHGDHTVRLMPHAADSARDQESRQQPYEVIELVFASGHLAERRVLTMPGERVTYHETYGKDGTVKWFNGDGKELGQQKLQLQSAPAPNLQPETSHLVILPMPYRSRDHVRRDMQQVLAKGSEAYEGLGAEAALTLFAGELASQHPSDAVQLYQRCFHERGDRRLGFLTLLGSCGVQTQSLPNYHDLFKSHADEPLARYLAQTCDPQGRQSQAEIGAIGGSPKGFVQRLAAFHDVYVAWRSGRADQGTEAQRQAERERLLKYVRENSSRLFGWALLDQVERQYGIAFVMSLPVADVYPLFEDMPVVNYSARYERARDLVTRGEWQQALSLFQDLYAQTLKKGVLPPLDSSFRQAFLSNAQEPTGWARFLKGTAASLIADGRRLAVLGLAWQCQQLGDPSLADDLFQQTFAGLPDKERTVTTLAGVEYLWQVGQAAQAASLIQPLLADAALAKQSSLWRLAAFLAGQNGAGPGVATYLEKALDLEYHDLPAVINLQTVRTDYGALLAHYQSLALAMATLEIEPPSDFVARVLRAADRWRSLDPDCTAACQMAARVFTALRQPEWAWEYLTTPIGLHPNQPAPWLAMAQTLRSEGTFLLADRAYAQAFDAEPTNAQILWDRAVNLQQAGQHLEAKKLFRQLADGQWQPRFNWIQIEARRQAE
jgi:ferric-dicitrate binding protein FerR (iron transport regulator)/tetratricopeptide (TPR) repeat protein